MKWQRRCWSCAFVWAWWGGPWVALGSLLALLWVCPGTLAAVEPRIVGMEHRGEHCVIRVSVPPGVVRVVVEACQRHDLRAWVPKATARVAPQETELTFSLASDAQMELFRVRSDLSDPLPAVWYTGDTQFPAEPLEDPVGWRPGLSDALPPTPEWGEALGDAESGVLRVQGDTLYFVNPLRGLQVFDLAAPEGVRLRGTFPLPGQGEQLFPAGGDLVVVLTRDPCREWGLDAESALVVIDTGATPPAERARLPLRGRIVESRWVGTALHVATETWEPVHDGSGSWRAGTRVASFDFATPTAPVSRGSLWFPGAGHVVTATDAFLLIAADDHSQAWPWTSALQVLDISSPDGTVATWVRIPVPGRIPHSASMDLQDDVLRLVVEAVEAPDTQRWVTVLETYRLSDPRSLSLLPVALLDRLELARGERLSFVRLDAGRGYFSTFDPTEPLWMIDLSDPSNLRIAGEVNVPGGSTFLHPMGDRLLTLGWVQVPGSPVAAQLFDVSDPFRPQKLASVPFGELADWKAGGLEPRELGVFPEQGLVVVPSLQDSRAIQGRGVRLVDLGRHTLSARGFLKADGWGPERSILHRERLLTVSARSLVSAEIGDRDQPRTASSQELAYTVDRVLVVGDHLLEFHQSTVRIRRSDGTGSWTVVDLGALPVLGAEEKGGVVHLLQGRGAEVSWQYDAASSAWTSRTNSPGWLLASVWDASHLPSLIQVGQSGRPTALTGMGDAEGHWLRDHELVWSSTTELRSRWELGGPQRDAESAVMDGVAVVSGGPWQPWQGTRARHLTAVDVSNPSVPRICSELVLGGNSGRIGAVAQAGSLIFSSRRRMDPEVVGRQEVAAMAWYAGAPAMETTEMMDRRGQSRTDFWAWNEAEWRSESEGFPRMRWWTRHELDVVDYRAGLDRPVVRPSVPIPGDLEGVAQDGALLFTKTGGLRADGSPVTTLDAIAYDGVSAHRIDSLAIAHGMASEPVVPVAWRAGMVVVARRRPGDAAKPCLETWSMGDDGRWRAGSRVDLGMVPGELQWMGEWLMARNGAAIEWFRLGAGAGLEPHSLTWMPGCFAGDLGRAAGDNARGIWLPLGEHGSYRLGP